MTTRFLLFSAPINPQTASALMQCLVAAYNDPGVTDITIAFASTGGDVHSGVALHGLLRAAPKPVVMHAIGTVASIAITVYLGAAVRRATIGCLFFFHPMSAATPGGTVNRVSLDAAAKMLEADEARLGELWKAQTRLDGETVLSLFRTDCMMSAEWGCDHGLVDQIGELNIPAHVGVVAVAT